MKSIECRGNKQILVFFEDYTCQLKAGAAFTACAFNSFSFNICLVTKLQISGGKFFCDMALAFRDLILGQLKVWLNGNFDGTTVNKKSSSQFRFAARLKS